MTVACVPLLPLLVVLVTVAFVAYRTQANEVEVRTAAVEIEASNNLLIALQDAQTAARRFVLTADRGPFEMSRHALEQDRATLLAAAAGETGPVREAAAEMLGRNDAEAAYLAKYVAAARVGRIELAPTLAATAHGEQLTAAFRAAKARFDAMVQSRRRLGREKLVALRKLVLVGLPLVA
ncbi:MAG: hypothetical protein JWN27_503, partial [Candidatus Eremiobacteraeota bacterium]|nr:hypothetical protein [Candidatus Eremiobacteraeota bacterium]